MISEQQNKIFRELCARKVLTEEDCEHLAESLEHSGTDFNSVLQELSDEKGTMVIQYMAKKFNLEYRDQIHLDSLPEKIASVIQPDYLKEHCLCPFSHEEGTLLVASSDPFDFTHVKNIGVLTGVPVRQVLTRRENILSTIEFIAELKAEKSGELAHEVTESLPAGILTGGERTEDLLDMANKAPVIKLVNSILYEAIKERATDIHIQPEQTKLIVKYRIDGILHTIHTLSLSMHQPLVSRVKIMGQLDIAEKRQPQDGRMSITFQQRRIDIRISILPMYEGQRVVLRVLDKHHLFHDLSNLGLDQDELNKIMQSISFKNGLLFVSGPTGSGKTTTLYACLSAIDSLENNVLTIEDPIEYSLPGISQMQVASRGGVQFADGLRSMLRHDPDVIMVGEVRDIETARITVRASLTGHLVLSTLHTTDAAEAITRLLDLGIEPFLLASSLSVVVAQRLVRTICPECKERFKPDKIWLSRWGKYVPGSEQNEFFRGKGCANCHNTGYHGRVGIFEVLVITEEVRDSIREKADSEYIKKLLRTKKHKDLTESGLKKVREGCTTIEEVFRVLQS